MLVFRIIATVFVALSMFTSILKNICFFNDLEIESNNLAIMFVFANLYCVLWRAFVIVAIWLV